MEIFMLPPADLFDKNNNFNSQKYYLTFIELKIVFLKISRIKIFEFSQITNNVRSR